MEGASFLSWRGGLVLSPIPGRCGKGGHVARKCRTRRGKPYYEKISTDRRTLRREKRGRLDVSYQEGGNPRQKSRTPAVFKKKGSPPVAGTEGRADALTDPVPAERQGPRPKGGRLDER